ncbi:DUF3817 domain-containing protein [Fulvivirga sp. M361]|uniref:DUF3817 domain-containing protein n=1 Tax=Fulvivirga sp. M361 TaxID=2594266 RepID=UPI00117BB898|nr:DUF3817 domain-containing protein [Fulvivirga sp. M361]TRX60568.1 DUF3817 domain-containing protein [Fulvivirga sp. M361]
MIDSLKTQLGRFRVLAFAEGVSFLLILFVTMPLKYLMDMPGPNKIIGMAHGILFVLYVLAVIQIRIDQEWNTRKTLIALLASIVPFGTFYVTAKMLPKHSPEER